MTMKFDLIAQLDVPSQCDMQRDFMRQAEMGVSTREAVELAVALVREEVMEELLPAIYKMLAYEDRGLPPGTEEWEAHMVEIADGIVDSVYVLFQLANTLELPFDVCFEAVHKNNLTKIQRGESGKLLKRDDGKLLKPEGYEKVDLAAILFPKLEETAEVATAEVETVPHPLN